MNYKDKYLSRIIDKEVNNLLDCFGAVCIEGPKWCGKTRTSLLHSKSNIFLADPSYNFNNKNLAIMNPKLILDGETPRLIDEWQEVPQIWDAVRYEVDFRSDFGQFILTASSTPKRNGIIHSGAGRIAKIKMRTMSLFETGDSTGDVSLKDICDGKDISKFTGEISLTDLANYIIRGGWPANLKVSKENQYLLPKKYIETILDNEIFIIQDKKYDIHKIELLLKSLARNESTTASRRKIINDIKEFDGDSVDSNTIANYLNLFENMFLIENQLPFSSNVKSKIRIKQSEKLHFCDPSLAATILNLNEEKLINDLQTFGFLFEALVEHDLRIYAENFGAKLYHYQDYNNDEIDAIIELNDGNYVAIEIKLGANQIDDAANNLIKLKNKIEKNNGKAPKELVVICGLTNACYKRNDGVYVTSLTALKD